MQWGGIHNAGIADCPHRTTHTESAEIQVPPAAVLEQPASMRQALNAELPRPVETGESESADNMLRSHHSFR